MANKQCKNSQAVALPTALNPWHWQQCSEQDRDCNSKIIQLPVMVTVTASGDSNHDSWSKGNNEPG